MRYKSGNIYHSENFLYPFFIHSLNHKIIIFYLELDKKYFFNSYSFSKKTIDSFKFQLLTDIFEGINE